MFRHLGLRHLCVVPDDLRLAGIITRHDLLASNLKGPARASQSMEESPEGQDVALVRSTARGAAAHRRQQRWLHDDGLDGHT